MIEKNTVMVYESGKIKHTFLYDCNSHGEKFYVSVKFSNSGYLNTGRFAEYMYNPNNCRVATAEEIKKYNDLIKTSKYGRNIIQPNLI